MTMPVRTLNDPRTTAVERGGQPTSPAKGGRFTTIAAFACLAGVVLALLLGLIVVWSSLGSGRITAKNCERIKLGMTRAEVSEMLGESGPSVVFGADGRNSADYTEYKGGSRGRRMIIQVTFDKDDRVTDKAFQEESTEAWLSRLLRQ